MNQRILSILTAKSQCGIMSAIAAWLLVAPAASAQTYTWDANGTTAGQTDGAGAWLGTGQWWTGTTNVDWSAGANAAFGYGGAGGAVTLASPTTVGSLIFNYFTGTYTLGTAGQAITLNGGMTKNPGSGAVAIVSPVTLGAAQTWTNNSTQNINIQSIVDQNGNTLTFDGAGVFNFDNASAGIAGSGGIVKNGTGQLIFSTTAAPTYTFTGDITLNGGYIGFQTSAVLGGRNTKITGGYLGGRFSSGFTWSGGLGTGANQIQITGGVSGLSGEGGTGSTFQIGTALSTLVWGAAGEGTATGFFNPSVFLTNGDARMNANGKGSLNNGIDLNGTTRTFTSLQTTDGAATSGFTISGAIINSNGTAGIIKTGVGNLILAANNTFTGATTINRGSITLSGSGAINATSALTLNNGGLVLVNTAQVNRFADAAAIAASGSSSIVYTNTSGANTYTETLGTVTQTSGQLNFVLSTDQVGAGSQKLTLGGYSRSGTSTATFSAAGAGLNATKNTIFVTGATATPANQIIGPWATAGTSATAQNKWAVYDVSGNVVPDGIADTTEVSWTNSTTDAWSLNPGANTALSTARTTAALRFYGASATLDLGNNNLSTNGVLFSGANAMVIGSTGTGVLSTIAGGNLYITAGLSVTHTISAFITNAGGTTNLVKSGSGTVILNGAGNYTFGGDIAVNGGTLQIGASQISTQLSGGSYSGNIFIAAGATLAFQGNATNTLSGVISGDGNLNLNRGTTILSGSNTYTGKTSIILVATNAAGSTVSVSSFNSVVGGSASSSLGAPTTIANGTIDFGGGGIQQTAQIAYTGSGETTDRIINFQFNGSGARVLDSSGTANALLKFTSPFISNGTATGSVTLQGSSNGEIVGGLPFAFTNLTKAGAGTWTLGGVTGNTGVTTISAGALAVSFLANGGNASSIGQGSNAATNLVFGAPTATLRYIGSANVVTDRSFTMSNGTGGGATIESSGAGTLSFNNTVAIAYGAASQTRVLTLGGTNTGANTFGKLIANNTSATSVVKNGTGTWILDQNNTYTGTTTINAGILVVNGAHITGTGYTVNGGTLTGSGNVSGPVVVTANGTVAGGDPSVNTANTLSFLNGFSTTAGSKVGVKLFSPTPDNNTPGSPNPSSNTYLLVAAGSTVIDAGTIFVLSGNLGLDGSTTLNYRIASGTGDQSGLNITNPLQFDTTGLTNGNLYTYSITGDNSNGGNAYLNMTPVPEPVAVGLFAVAGLGLSRLARRRHRAH